jgi:uncharacterized protein
MKKIKHFVFDTNSLMSAFLIKSSVSARALDAALEKGRLVMSESCLQEFSEVIFRKKFDAYFPDESERLEIIEKVERSSLIFFPEERIKICRDVKDDKFLELAVASNASCIISGDKDLLILHPFRDIFILTPADFLKSQVLSED